MNVGKEPCFLTFSSQAGEQGKKGMPRRAADDRNGSTFLVSGLHQPVAASGIKRIRSEFALALRHVDQFPVREYTVVSQTLTHLDKVGGYQAVTADDQNDLAQVINRVSNRHIVT